MPVTSSTARVEFFIGKFDTETSLTLPNVDDNSMSLRFNPATPVSAQLAFFNNTLIYALHRVTFNGTQIYQNPQYASFPFSGAPANPDMVITQGVPNETVVTNNYIPMIPDSTGKLANGTYVFETRFVYFSSLSQTNTSELGTFTSAYSFNQVAPSLFQKYNTGSIPFLTTGDQADYDTQSVVPTWQTEIILYPPKNKTLITTILTNSSSTKVTSFFTGGNEMNLVSYFQYNLATSYINYVASAYDSFTIYNIDNCSIFECIQSLYDAWNASECATKKAAITLQDLIKGTALAQQLITGQFCGNEDLNAILQEFNAICDCECDCLNEEVIQISAAITRVNIQTVTATTATTTIDLSLGSTVYINLATSGTTNIIVTNIDVDTEYRFAFRREFSTQAVTFNAAQFEDGAGALAGFTAANTIIIMTFYTRAATRLTLESKNN